MTLLPPGAKPAPTPALLERILAGGAHLSGFVDPLLIPLLIWLVLGKWQPFAARHARHALVTHLLSWLAIGALGLLAVAVFLLLLGGAVSVPPAGGHIQLIYFTVFVLLLGAALLVWVSSQVSCVVGAIQAIQGKPAPAFWRKHR